MTHSSRFVDRLQANAIIVRGGGQGAARMQGVTMLPRRTDAKEREEAGSARKLLRDLIAIHKTARKR